MRSGRPGNTVFKLYLVKLLLHAAIFLFFLQL